MTKRYIEVEFLPKESVLNSGNQDLWITGDEGVFKESETLTLSDILKADGGLRERVAKWLFKRDSDEDHASWEEVCELHPDCKEWWRKQADALINLIGKGE